MKAWRYFIHFGYQQAMSCIFPVAIFATLAVSNVIDIPFLYRYDFILLICLIVQLLMFRTGMETVDELKVIGVFHIIGLTLELYKVHMGSWAYPEEAWTKVFGVPLYSGFMYASVASYMCQAWRRLHLNLRGWPVFLITVPLGAMIYFNFFTHHFIFDIRWILMIILVIVFIRTYVEFQVDNLKLKMPLVLSFFLIGFFVWIAENISTLFGAWQYPNQGEAWEIVHIGKISSWFLLVIVSFIIVAQLKHIKERKV
ncbi:uncharacterized membrane protein YoaT (DUF817 family) [Salibacterium salarium]|uniref:DUF817 domain-containing protein n=1 Tax=Salibacterium salarium TaxID=284579 RepID=UPI00278333A1|nr:DUF817 domain-containing protein [Salibacterium salarium]MDQ0300212.1 uncharacterized membrane protein YoaT (DUF817 family) [Salibacterium salarium]